MAARTLTKCPWFHMRNTLLGRKMSVCYVSVYPCPRVFSGLPFPLPLSLLSPFSLLSDTHKPRMYMIHSLASSQFLLVRAEKVGIPSKG